MTHTPLPSNNVPDNNPLKRRWDERGETSAQRRQRTTEVGLAIAQALGSRPTPWTKFWAAYADGSRVRLADSRRWEPLRDLPGPIPSSPAHVERTRRRTDRGPGSQVRGLLPGPSKPLADTSRSRMAQPRGTGFQPRAPTACARALDQHRAERGVEHPESLLLGLQGEPPQRLTEGPEGRTRRVLNLYSLPLSMEGGRRGGESIDDLMAGELTEEAMEEILVKGKGGKRSRMQADLEDRVEIVGSEDSKAYYQRYKRLRPLQMTTAWNSVHTYAKYAYKDDAGLLPPIPVELPHPEVRAHIDQADQWFEREVPRKAPGRRHRLLVIEGVTGTGKTAYARSKGTRSRMCNVWNVGALSEDADVWILNDMVHTNRQDSLKALSQYEADFTGRYKHVNMMKVRPTIILGNSQSAIMKCWSDIEGEEGEAWVAGNVDWVYTGQAPFLVFP